MRYFNTSGPCDPKEHFTVLRQKLIAKGIERVRRGRYITIFAPRQAGKTTYFHLLIEKSQADEQFIPIWISFENLHNTDKNKFYKAFSHRLQRELSKKGVPASRQIKDEVELSDYFEKIAGQHKKIALIIDEFEGVPDAMLGELMHTFRMFYHNKENYALHSLILIGVSTIAELIVSSASPFNIVDELKIPYFSQEEVRDLIGQYTAESGQDFDDDVIAAIYRNTSGQPGLVCALCAHLVEEIATDRTKSVAMDDFYKTLKHFLTERFDKNIVNIVQKAREKKDFMLQLLFSDEPTPFTVHHPEIGYLYAHGVLENIDGVADVDVPLYKKVLLTAFRPAINGEIEYYVSAHDNFSEYVDADGLNIRAILKRYVEYVARRGFQAFDTEYLKEGAWHYSLDGFINFFIERLGGKTFVEVPTGRGRTDILIVYQEKKYIIETKIFTDLNYFEKGKRQLAAYLQSEGVDEGFYVVFSKKHAQDDVLEQEEMIDGKRIVTRIVRVNFEQASTGRF